MSTFLLPLLFFFAAQAQQATTPNPADSCTIQGVVVKAGTGEPLHKAIVEAQPSGGRSEGFSAVTDAMGRFELKGLAPGRYDLSAERNGFVTQQYGQRTPDGPGAMLTLSAGQKIPDIIFQMIPAAAITGHVFDEDGEPVLRARVATMQYRYINGQRQPILTHSVTTNDLGEFRIFGLSPGQYFVQAGPAIQFDNPKTKQGHVPVYYPGFSDADRAAPILVRGGDEFSGVDISLQPARTFTVRGHVINSGCEGTDYGETVLLTGQNSRLTPFPSGVVHDANGQSGFEFSSVPPGSYYLSARLFNEGKQCVGRQPLEVSDADIDGVALAITPGVEIKGRVHVEGQLDSNLGSFSVSLLPRNTNLPFAGRPSDPAKPDGSFLLKNAFDGDYEIFVGNQPENYYLKSARLDGVDVLTAGVTVDSKHTPGMLEIVVSPNGAGLDGVVSKDEQPYQGATVALVPDPPHRGERRLFKATTTDQLGRFVLQGLSPGDYKVFAWEKIEHGAYTSAEFLQLYENLGKSVHITEGSRNSVKLDLIPAKDSNP
ncbi:MAG TPA: carboxypeptidase-like regulatory domain-containing protein [Terriglobia bacterium]|nr:carboxypeptidase-like regulatory domain-containing protein [Terriglobia bacterium]